jgi:hypothetical protein
LKKSSAEKLSKGKSSASGRPAAVMGVKANEVAPFVGGDIVNHPTT